MSKNDEFCTKNEEFCTKIKELCTKNKEFCIKHDEFCRWMAFEISTSRLCYNNRATKVRFDLYKVARDGFHHHLSSCDTTVEALCRRASGE